MPHALSDRLHKQSHRPARDRHIPLRTQHVLFARKPLDRCDQRIDIGDFRQVDDHGGEIIVLVLFFAVMMRGTSSKIVFCRRFEAQDDPRLDHATNDTAALEHGVASRPR